MSSILNEKDLPSELTPEQAVEAAYSRELAEVASKLNRGLPTLLECDKDLAPFVFLNLRTRLREVGMVCRYLDGRPRENEQQGPVPVGILGTMINQLRDAVRGSVEQVDKQGRPVRTVIVLPHLDLLTTSQGGLTGEAREVIVLLYENPTIVFLGFKDPSFQVPKVIEALFPYRSSLLGLSRDRLRHLITQRESRKFGKQFNPWGLYKYVSGVNAARLRKLLSTLEGEDYPADPKQAYRQLRQATLTGTMEIPDVDLDRDIGGYAKTKKQLRQEILEILTRRDKATSEEDVRRMEELIPRGMIFWGPPGTGKTFFAKAIASAIGAAITIVSGPELKSKWVGESEEQLRQVFLKARQSAPAIIVFDEIDSFATARGTYTGSGVEHSMVNQLLTEMDGFHKEELVFVVGTTNFVESLDPALLRPGRFEFHLHIPYPEDDDRREILKIYDKKMGLKFTEKALQFAVDRTGESYMTAQGTPFSGDHLQALCRAVSRIRLRDDRTDETVPADIERAVIEYEDRLDLTEKEEKLVAVHEAGHLVVALACPEYPRPERITIKSDVPWAGGYVRFEKDKTMRLGWTRQRFLDMLCVSMGGIEAERLLIGDVTTGAGGGPGSDLGNATRIAHGMVELFGMGGPSTGLRVYRDAKGEREVLSGAQAEALDKQIQALLNSAQERAAKILKEHRVTLEKVRAEVLEKKSLEKERIAEIIAEFRHNPKGNRSEALHMDNSDKKPETKAFLISGIVHPERADVHLQLPPFQLIYDDGQSQMIVHFSILKSHIACVVETAEKDIYTIRNHVKSLVETHLNVYGFLHGMAYQAEITKIFNQSLGEHTVFGVDLPCLANRRDADGQKTAFRELVFLNMDEEGMFLQRCLSDLNLAMRILDDSAFYCYRAIEALRHYVSEIAELNTQNEAKQWEKLAEIAPTDPDEFRTLKKKANESRHGKPTGITGDEREKLLKTTWSIVEAVVDYCLRLKGSNVTLSSKVAPKEQSR